ncbi:uncharacterized protein [Epargyreus clarus]|uniref:uncharacterized protein n=1 Tax=Epargyreus clarus TaxID=520877 RepID=UPI003C2B3D04
MKESYPEDIMLCFVQGFGDRNVNDECKSRECNGDEAVSDGKKKHRGKRVSVTIEPHEDSGQSEFDKRRGENFVGKSLRLSSGDKFFKNLPEVKRSFSDRFSIITDGSGKKAQKGLSTIRKTW